MEIMLPGGESLRPDQVLLGKEQTIVIDFKTGKELAAHSKQIKKYASVLTDMGYPTVKSYLVYISDQKVVNV